MQKGLTAPLLRYTSHSPRFYPSLPGAPREPFQGALPTELYELRQATPALPPLFKLPKHQAERTPDDAGFRLKPAPRHRITLKFTLFASHAKKGLTAPLLRHTSHSPRFYPSPPGAPREPYQPVPDGPMSEARQETPAQPPLPKEPKHQAERTPDDAGPR